MQRENDLRFQFFIFSFLFCRPLQGLSITKPNHACSLWQMHQNLTLHLVRFLLCVLKFLHLFRQTESTTIDQWFLSRRLSYCHSMFVNVRFVSPVTKSLKNTPDYKNWMCQGHYFLSNGKQNTRRKKNKIHLSFLLMILYLNNDVIISVISSPFVSCPMSVSFLKQYFVPKEN